MSTLGNRKDGIPIIKQSSIFEITEKHLEKLEEKKINTENLKDLLNKDFKEKELFNELNKQKISNKVIDMILTETKKTNEKTMSMSKVLWTAKTFDEGWIQDLIISNPELLPVNEIEPKFGPLISIGKEVSLKDKDDPGSIDNLYINHNGYLTIVETKLWRNPEARREVVGQIINYAADVSSWSFDDLDDRVKKYNKNPNYGVIDKLKEYDKNLDESSLRKKISENLSQGEFLLLIVGDGIRDSVKKMADYLSKPNLLYKLALVELQVYKLEDGIGNSLLAIPRVIMKTKEVERAVVRIEGKNISDIHIEFNSEPQSEEDKTINNKSKLNKEIFLSILSKSVEPELVKFAIDIIDDMREFKCESEWKQSTYVVKLPDPGGSNQKLSLFEVNKDGNVNISGYLLGQLYTVGIPIRIAYDYLKNVEQLFNFTSGWGTSISLKDLQKKYNEFLSITEKTIDEIKKANSIIEPLKEKFLTMCPDELLKNVYEKWFNIWENNKNIQLDWYVWGFALNGKVQKKYITISSGVPAIGGSLIPSLIKTKNLSEFGNPEKEYQKYVNKIKFIPGVGEILNSKSNSYMNHRSVTPEDLETILQATTDFAEEVMDKN